MIRDFQTKELHSLCKPQQTKPSSGLREQPFFWHCSSPFVGVIVGVVSLSAAALFGCWYVPAYFRRYDGVLHNGAVHVTHGVISISHTVIPLRHVLTVSISATPLMRVFGVRMVTLGMPSHRILLHCVRREAVETLAAHGGETDA